MATNSMFGTLSTNLASLRRGGTGPQLHVNDAASKPTFRLLDLHLEIRQEILGHLLLKGTPIKLEPVGKNGLSYGRGLGINRIGGLFPVILSVNRQLHTERRRTLYGLNVFLVESLTLFFVTKELPSYIQDIFKVRFTTFSHTSQYLKELASHSLAAQKKLDKDGAEDIRLLGSNFVGLHSLEIDVSPFKVPSRTESSELIQALQKLPLPHLHSLKIVGIDDEDLVKSIKEKVEKHRRPPTEAACKSHSRMLWTAPSLPMQRFLGPLHSVSDVSTIDQSKAQKVLSGPSFFDVKGWLSKAQGWLSKAQTKRPRHEMDNGEEREDAEALQLKLRHIGLRQEQTKLEQERNGLERRQNELAQEQNELKRRMIQLRLRQLKVEHELRQLPSSSGEPKGKEGADSMNDGRSPESLEV